MDDRWQTQMRVEPHLPDGEAYLVAFAAKGGWAPTMAHRFRVVVVTDRAVHLYKADWWLVGKPGKLLASLPWNTVITSTPFEIWEELHLAGERLWVSPPWQEALFEAKFVTRDRASRPFPPPGL